MMYRLKHRPRIILSTKVLYELFLKKYYLFGLRIKSTFEHIAFNQQLESEVDQQLLPRPESLKKYSKRHLCRSHPSLYS